MTEPLIDRLARHVAVFEEIGRRNVGNHYEEIQERGHEALKLAADIREAMETILMQRAEAQ